MYPCRGKVRYNIYPQVTESLTRDNIKREIRALNSLGDEIGCEIRTVITWTGGGWKR